MRSILILQCAWFSLLETNNIQSLESMCDNLKFLSTDTVSYNSMLSSGSLHYVIIITII
jgi:hypothetical protein